MDHKTEIPIRRSEAWQRFAAAALQAEIAVVHIAAEKTTWAQELGYVASNAADYADALYAEMEQREEMPARDLEEDGETQASDVDTLVSVAGEVLRRLDGEVVEASLQTMSIPTPSAGYARDLRETLRRALEPWA